MHITIEIDSARDLTGRRAVRVRTKWRASATDDMRIKNCGAEIYDAIKEGFGTGFVGGIIQHLGETTK